MPARVYLFVLALLPVIAQAQPRSSSGPADDGHGMIWGLAVTIVTMLLWGAASRFRTRHDLRV